MDNVQCSIELTLTLHYEFSCFFSRSVEHQIKSAAVAKIFYIYLTFHVFETDEILYNQSNFLHFSLSVCQCNLNRRNGTHAVCVIYICNACISSYQNKNRSNNGLANCLTHLPENNVIHIFIIIHRKSITMDGKVRMIRGKLGTASYMHINVKKN